MANRPSPSSIHIPQVPAVSNEYLERFPGDLLRNGATGESKSDNNEFMGHRKLMKDRKAESEMQDSPCTELTTTYEQHALLLQLELFEKTI